MSEPLGIGVVGAGAIGIRAALTHLSVDDVKGRVRLAAVCDPVEGRAAAAAGKYGVPAAYVTCEELLADPKGPRRNNLSSVPLPHAVRLDVRGRME